MQIISMWLYIYFQRTLINLVPAHPQLNILFKHGENVLCMLFKICDNDWQSVTLVFVVWKIGCQWSNSYTCDHVITAG